MVKLLDVWKASPHHDDDGDDDDDEISFQISDLFDLVLNLVSSPYPFLMNV